MKNLILFTIFVAFISADNFDVRNKWNCPYEILTQGCGDCWNFAGTETFSDRMCASGLSKDTMSPEVSLECNGKQSCNGGVPQTSWNYFIENGTSTCTNTCTGGCVKYQLQNGQAPPCHFDTCDNGSKWPAIYKGGSFKRLKSGSISTYQNELKKNGPIHMCFDVYDNFSPFFQQNPNGIYTKKSGSYVGYHCVKLMGYGTSGGIDYWTLANSWGTTFAAKGYFKMERGINLCEIEGQVSAGYTKKQSPAAEGPQEKWVEEEGGEEKEERLGGGWIEREDLEEELFFVVGKFGLERAMEREGEKGWKMGRILKVETQVVAGVNYRVLVELRGGDRKVEVMVMRDLEWDLKLMGYEVLF